MCKRRLSCKRLSEKIKIYIPKNRPKKPLNQLVIYQLQQHFHIKIIFANNVCANTEQGLKMHIIIVDFFFLII